MAGESGKTTVKHGKAPYDAIFSRKRSKLMALRNGYEPSFRCCSASLEDTMRHNSAKMLLLFAKKVRLDVSQLLGPRLTAKLFELSHARYERGHCIECGKIRYYLVTCLV